MRKKAQTRVWPCHQFANAYVFTEDDLAEIFRLSRRDAQPPPAPELAVQPEPRHKGRRSDPTPPAVNSYYGRPLVAKHKDP